MTLFRSGLLLALVSLLLAHPVYATGEIGEHVKDLKSHLEDYTAEVRWFLAEADKIVETYANTGHANTGHANTGHANESQASKAKPAIDPAKLVENWEAVKFHAAIETNYVPVYASIWQGIFGVHDAIKQGKPAAEVRKQQVALEEAMWQALGAVKLAAKYQAEGPAVAEAPLATDPVATLGEIKNNLDRVVAKYAERDIETATSLVHETYANRFEGVEGALIEQDAALVEDLEKDFNVILPQRIQGGKEPVQAVEATVKGMKSKLDRAQSLLRDAEQNRRSVF